jgi:hypothetical protein
MQIHFEKSNGATQAVAASNPLPVTLSVTSDSDFGVTVNSNNALSPVRLVDGEAGKSIKITNVVISSQTATQVTLQDEDGTVVLGPIYVAANTPVSMIVALTVTEAKDLNFKTSTQTNVTISVSGMVI